MASSSDHINGEVASVIDTDGGQPCQQVTYQLVTYQLESYERCKSYTPRHAPILSSPLLLINTDSDQPSQQVSLPRKNNTYAEANRYRGALANDDIKKKERAMVSLPRKKTK